MAAARLLAAIVDANTSFDGLTDNDHGHPQYKALDQRDRALVRAILLAALRHRNTIEAMIAARLDRPLPSNAHTLSHILHIAAAQILFLNVPGSAAVDIAVTHAGCDPRTKRFSGLVNAVLRGIGRKRGDLGKVLAKTTDAPGWFADMLSADYGDARARAIIAMHRHEAPVDFTVKSDPPHWANKLGGAVMPTGTVRVPDLPASVPDLPGFGDGQWWVQDAAAALPARMLGDIAGKRVADLCAAPGGKTAQLAHAGAHVTALDLSANRLKRLEANLDRLGLKVETAVSDLRKYEPGERFDAVLLDAPCSSTGTIRRHPDVPWTKSPADIEKLAALQLDLLEAAFALVKPGGMLVFSNCSLLRCEGEDIAQGFAANHASAGIAPVLPGEIAGADGFITPQGWLRTTPEQWPDSEPRKAGLDGFFAARFRRVA